MPFRVALVQQKAEAHDPEKTPAGASVSSGRQRHWAPIWCCSRNVVQRLCASL